MRTPLLLLTFAMLSGCTWTPAQARTANSVLNGVACGVAAAQETPCTPQAVLDALARDTEAQQAKIAALAPAAAAVDPALTKLLVDQLSANTASNAAVAKALLELAARQPLPQYPLAMEPMPPLPPPPAPLPRAPAVLPPPAPVPVPPPPPPSSAQPTP